MTNYILTCLCFQYCVKLCETIFLHFNSINLNKLIDLLNRKIQQIYYNLLSQRRRDIYITSYQNSEILGKLVYEGYSSRYARFEVRFRKRWIANVSRDKIH